MSVTKTFAGQTFNLPQNKEPKSSNWGLQVSNFLIRVADFAIPKTGGTFALTAADLDLGTTYGLISKYVKSNTTPIATTTAAFLKLAYADGISWRNNANNGNLDLTLASDRLQFGGSNLLLASDSASTSTADKLVLRDGSGNFAANVITAASFSGPITGNASTATKWHTARTINLGSDLSGSVLIDGSADVTLNATIAPNSVALGIDTTGNYVATIAGTTNQVSVSGSGSETAAVTLSLPQDIATTSTPTFSNVSLTTLSALKLPVGATGDRPGSPVAGQVRYNSDTSSYEGYSSGAWSALGGGGTVDRITQASHGFVLGDILYLNGSTYTKAIATAANTAEVVGMVSRVIDSSTFEFTISGEVTGLSSLTAGAVYFLSDTTAGTISTTEPSTIGYVSLPLGVASSTTSFYVTLKRGLVIGGTNARSQLSLSNNTTATIQNVSAYDAGELTGWIYIDATTDYKFYFQAPFAKNGAGTNYNISPSFVGDTPPAGFSLSITSAGLIQYTMPSVTGFGSALVNFALNAPAVGATFPLNVDGSYVTEASATAPGVVSTGTQTFAGNKTFSGTVSASNLIGGRYTPTFTAGTNISSLTSYSAIYHRVGNIVIVSGKVDVTLTASGYATFGISFPIASSGLTGNDAWGMCNRFNSSASGFAGVITGDATNKRATVELFSTITGAMGTNFTFQYEIK